MTGLAHPGRLTLCSIDKDARPMTWIDADGTRRGFEPEVASALAGALALELAWVDRNWAEFVPTLESGACDAVLCSQAVTPYRLRVVDFTIPYGAFDEAVLVRRGSGIRSPEDLMRRRIGAIEPSTNMDLARTFAAVELVGFDGRADDILGEMLAALTGGGIDALVDDELVLLEVAALRDDLELAFVVPTQNRYALAVRKGDDEIRSLLDRGLRTLRTNGALVSIWRRWFPDRPFPAAG